MNIYLSSEKISFATDDYRNGKITDMDFPAWLNAQMVERGMSQSDLSRAAKISNTAISNVLSGMRSPGPELCTAIAKALGYPPEIVFQAAGLLPVPDDLTVQEIKMQHLYKQLTIQEQRTLYAIGLTLKGQREAEE